MERNDIIETVGNSRIDGIRTLEEGGDYGSRRRKVVVKQVSPKPPSPKAPTAYWEDPKGEKGAEIGQGKDTKGKESKCKGCKGRGSKRKGFQRERSQWKGGQRKRFQMGKNLVEGRRRSRSCKE